PRGQCAAPRSVFAGASQPAPIPAWFLWRNDERSYDVSTILVIANETVESPILHEAIRATAAGAHGVEVVIVAPALNSRPRHWVSDEDDARRRAKVRLERCLASVTAVGLDARGWISDAAPLQAIGDALHLASVRLILIPMH